MKRLVAALFAASISLAPASAALKVGAAAPDFTAPATLGGKEFTFALSDALKKGPVVLDLSGGVHQGLHDRGARVRRRDAAL